jgi:hypothetical protein
MNIPTYFLLAFCAIFCLSFSNNDVKYLELKKDSIDIGKKIYSTGVGISDQKIMALSLGKKMPATIFACSTCHGDCGAGQKLQGLDVPDIRRKGYMKRYSLDSNSPNLEKEINFKIKRFISFGINHSDEKVSSMMPKYQMSNVDMDHLLAYLAVLGSEQNCINK